MTEVGVTETQQRLHGFLESPVPCGGPSTATPVRLRPQQLRRSGSHASPDLVQDTPSHSPKEKGKQTHRLALLKPWELEAQDTKNK